MSGVVNLFLIAHYFSYEIQGYYYTFSSLLALQAFVELGLSLVIVSLVSHQWAYLEINSSGEVVGNLAAKSRLSYLALHLIRWYSIAGTIFLVGVGCAGYYFLRRIDAPNINWREPWFFAIICMTVQFCTIPLFAILEGCNQLRVLSRFRFTQAILVGVCGWLFFIINGELWIIGGIYAVGSISSLFFLLNKYNKFFRSLLIAPARYERLNWKKDIWPMQWRISLQGVVNYFANFLFVPVIFDNYGAVLAGQMGMTLQLITAIHSLSVVWVQTKAPLLGILITKKKYKEASALWISSAKTAFFQSAFSSGILFFGVIAINFLSLSLAFRVLDPITFGIFLLAYLSVQIIQYQSYYLRAFAMEPYVVLGTIGSITIGLGVYIFGREYGALGAGLSLLIINVIFILPIGSYIFMKRKKEWQTE